jgi:protein-S-isoprenylcysteine O-methyltransferase Ste14
MSVHPTALEKNIGSNERTNMNQLVMQVVLAVGSWPGILMGWMSGYRGQGRIPQPLAGIITNLGPLIMIAPWIAMPLLAQPRLVGSGRTIVFIIGILLLAAAALIIIWATPFIFPAAKKGGDELDPEFLVVKGPYRWVRHAQYLGGVLGLIGWALLRGGFYSILFSPISYLLFRFEAYLEENRVLEPKFGAEFQQFKKRVPAAILGRVGTIILLVAYLAIVSLVVFGKVTIG